MDFVPIPIFWTFLCDILYDLEEEKTEKRKEQKRKYERDAYRKKNKASGYGVIKYRKGDQKLTRA